MNLKVTLTLTLICWLSLAIGQKTFTTCYVEGDSCYSVTYTTTGSSIDCADRHEVFRTPNKAPKRLARLGTNPQFGTLRNYTTTQEVYDHLNRAYVANEKGNARELDRLWVAMGYSGFRDTRFVVGSLTPVFYDGGVTGMLGAGGNTYLYASVSPGQDIKLKGYRVQAIDGCDVTIMEICGNAFYPNTSPTKFSATQTVSKKACKLNLPAGVDRSKVNVSSFIKDGKCFVRVCDKVENNNGQAPEVIGNLEHNSQFGSMVDLKTSQEVFDRLHELHRENAKGNAKELDRLMRGIGYNGLKDPRFTADKIEVTDYTGGVLGLMGSGEHQYMYTQVSAEKYDDLRGFQIKSLTDQCDLTIVDVCGNALHCPVSLNCQTFECDCN